MLEAVCAEQTDFIGRKYASGTVISRIDGFIKFV